MNSKKKSKSYNCADIEKLAQKYIDGNLNTTEQKTFAEHLEYCLPCDKKIEFEKKLKTVIKEKMKKNTLPKELNSRIHSLWEDLS